MSSLWSLRVAFRPWSTSSTIKFSHALLNPSTPTKQFSQISFHLNPSGRLAAILSTTRTENTMTVTEDAASLPTKPETKPLPELTPSEFDQYNHMAEHMDYFHNHFRIIWDKIYKACETNKRSDGMSIRQFLALGLDFCRKLTMHHTIEEVHVFPKLAKRMPAFKKELQLLSQHKQIHKGIDKMEMYLKQCRNGERELRLGELKEILDGFKDVLWDHLRDEVDQLRAGNMRKYWTLQEMTEMRM